MDATPDHDLAAHVAAWHNRHPLARRITPDQVQGMGVVALPFAASANKDKGALRSAFSDHFIAPLGARRVARFTLRYGTSTRTGPDDWPQRELAVKPGAASTGAQIRYLRTAAIDLRSQRTRVLIGGGKTPQVLGQRLWSRSRLAGAASVLGTALLILAAALGRFSAPAPEGPLLALAAASLTPDPAASRAAALSPPASDAPIGTRASATAAPGADTVQAAALASPTLPASALTSQARASASDAAPVAADGAPTDRSGRSSRDIRPALPTSESGEARQEARAVRNGSSERTGQTSIAASASASPSASAFGTAAAAAAATDNGRIYAVATPVTRTRAAAQLRIVLMNAPTYTEPGQPHAEVMQTSSGWRTVVWPYNTREAAERIREGLATRGIPAEVIEF